MQTLRIMRDTKGQDFIEYALMAAFVAVGAAALLPSVASTISVVLSQVGSVMMGATSQG
jgi:Flp pilus assembly pilin Flp